MSDDLLDTIQHLMDSGIGDFNRLDHILGSLKSGKKIYSSDQRYLEGLISKNVKIESVPKLVEESKSVSKSAQTELGKKLPVKTSPLWYYLPLFFNIIGGSISYFVLRKTDLSKAKKCFIFGLVLFLIPLIILVVANIIPGMQYSVFVVKNDATEQNLKKYDVVLADNNISFENIKVGDVIIFSNPGTHQLVLVHRVVDVISKDPFTIKAKGDKSSESIEGIDYPITKQEYIGKLAYVIPQVGYATKLVTTKSILIIIGIIIAIGISQHMLYRKRKSPPQNNV